MNFFDKEIVYSIVFVSESVKTIVKTKCICSCTIYNCNKCELNRYYFSGCIRNHIDKTICRYKYFINIL